MESAGFILFLAILYHCNIGDCFWDLEGIVQDAKAHNPFPGECGRTLRPIRGSYRRQRMTGGNTASPIAIPWIGEMLWRVALFNKGACAAVLLQDGRENGSDTVIIAANCIQRAKGATISFIFGARKKDEGRTAVAVAYKVIVHEEYNKITKVNDIAVVKLDRTIMFTDTIQPICLPNENDHLEESDVGLLAGWSSAIIKLPFDWAGSVNKRLQYILLPVTSTELCNSWYKNLDHPSGSTFCAAGRSRQEDVCIDDAGSPFLVEEDGRYVLHGILGFYRGCGMWSGTPHIYSRVVYYLGWIRRAVEQLKQS